MAIACAATASSPAEAATTRRDWDRLCAAIVQGRIAMAETNAKRGRHLHGVNGVLRRKGTMSVPGRAGVFIAACRDRWCDDVVQATAKAKSLQMNTPTRHP
jgi:hypothetical protein